MQLSTIYPTQAIKTLRSNSRAMYRIVQNPNATSKIGPATRRNNVTGVHLPDARKFQRLSESLQKVHLSHQKRQNNIRISILHYHIIVASSRRQRIQTRVIAIDTACVAHNLTPQFGIETAISALKCEKSHIALRNIAYCTAYGAKYLWCRSRICIVGYEFCISCKIQYFCTVLACMHGMMQYNTKLKVQK